MNMNVFDAFNRLIYLLMVLIGFRTSTALSIFAMNVFISQLKAYLIHSGFLGENSRNSHTSKILTDQKYPASLPCPGGDRSG